LTNNSIFEHALTISPLLRTAVEAAIAAGKIVAGGANEILVVEQKGIGDLVSQVDRDAESSQRIPNHVRRTQRRPTSA